MNASMLLNSGSSSFVVYYDYVQIRLALIRVVGGAEGLLDLQFVLASSEPRDYQAGHSTEFQLFLLFRRSLVN
jgi:hypothetical protein